MPPKKKTDETAIVNDYLDASYILDNPKKTISLGPVADMMLSGGIPEGTISIFAAPPKIGKTTLALKAMADGQNRHGKIGVYVSVENRLSMKNLTGVPGLKTDPDNFKIISSEKGKILSADQILEKAERALIDFPGCVMIFDSFSSLSSAAERTGKYGEGFGNVSARKMEGEFARRAAPIVQVNDNIILGIAHMTPNLNMPGSTTKISRAMLYQQDVSLTMKKVYPQGDWSSGNKLIGQKVQIEVLTSALGAPGGSWVGWLKYGEGFVNEAELAGLALDLNVIEKSGSWMKLEDFGVNVQGMGDMVDIIKSRPEIYEYLLKSVKEMLDES